MRDELLAAGLVIELAVVNRTGFDASLALLTAKGTFPVFQDSAEAGVWALHGGTKDDMFVYDAAGTLRAFLDFGGPVEINLSKPEGYTNVKTAWEAALLPLP